MAEVVKILSESAQVNTTATTVSSASLVRLINIDPNNNALVTHKNSDDDTIGSIVLGFAGSDESVTYVMKEPTDTLESNTTGIVYGTSVGFY